jgi:cardiolipin synthase
VALELEAVFGQGWRLGRQQFLAEGAVKTEDTLLRNKSRERSVATVVACDTGQGIGRREGSVAVEVVSNQEFRHRRRIRRAYLHAIRNAQRYILIENAYFIPDRGIRRALLKAVQRGVKVAVAVARHNDVAVAAMASRALYGELLAGGVRLFEWPETMLHAKTAVIDDAWSVVGSYNLDHRSLFHNLEVVIVLADADFAARLREQNLADLKQCRELTLDEHGARPWWQTLLDSAAYQMRYWL